MPELNILMLDDDRGGVQLLYDALDRVHALTWVRRIDAAIFELSNEETQFDVIICGTHLFSESMFDFLRQVKQEAHSKNIPFICFRTATTDFAEKSDGQIEQTAKLLGADAYILVPELNDPVRLRALVEEKIKPLVATR